MSDLDTRETHGGQTLTKRVWLLIDDAARAVGLTGVRVGQGGYKAGSGAGASAGTHDVGDVFDLSVRNVPADKQIPLVVELRKRNVCAWLRAPAYGWTQTGPHIHGVVRDSADGLSGGARQQVAAYDNGRNGLANNARDPFPRPAQQHWTPTLEDTVTPADIEAIAQRCADLVWARQFKELGGDADGDGQVDAHPASEYLVRGAGAAAKAAAK